MVRGVKIYAIISQCLIQMFVLMYLGYKLGADWWLEDGTWGAIFCVLGALLGIILMIRTVIKAGDIFDKRKDVQ